MPNIINKVPEKRPENEQRTVIDEHGQEHPSAQQRMQRAANRAAHKAAEHEQERDRDQNEFSGIGPE